MRKCLPDNFTGFLRLILLPALILTALVISPAEQLPLKTWTIANGLAHDYVQRIVQDSRGFLWFCTSDGLSRFDGERFVTYGVRDGLAFGYVNDLLESDGVYWVATNGGGVCRFTPSVASSGGAQGNSPRLFVTYPVGDSQPTSRINALYADRAGFLWAGSDGGLFRLDLSRAGGKFERVGMHIPGLDDSVIEAREFARDDDGSLWIGTSAGLVRRLPDGRFIHYQVRPSQAPDYVWALLKDREGRIWIGHHMGLMVFKPEPASQVSATTISLEQRALANNRQNDRLRLPTALGEARWYTTADGLTDQRVRALYERADGRVWLGTRTGGLAEFDGERFHNYTTAQGLSRRITTLAEDRAGNLWVGTQTGGAMKVARSGFTTWREADGLGSAEILLLFLDRAGDLIVVSSDWYIHRFDGHAFTAIRPNLPDRIIKASSGRWVVQDHLGEWWLASGEGLYRFPSVQKFEDLARVRPKALYTTREGLADNDISRLYEDSRGDLWIGSYNPPVTLARWERATGKFYRYGEADGMPHLNWVNAFAEDSAGNVWLGMHNGGLVRCRNGRFDYFGAAEGIPGGIVQGLYCDRQGRLWVATNGKGAARIDDPAADIPHVVGYTTADDMASDNLNCFAEDKWGRLYLGTSRGVDRLDLPANRSRHFTTSDGLTKSEVMVALYDNHDALWFGTREGLSRFIPEQGDPPEPPPPVVISGLRVAGQPQPIAELGQAEVLGLEVGANQSQIQIDFFGLGFSTGVPLRYQYKFEGKDRDWSAPAEQRTVTASLSPGGYRFLVRAVNADGQVSPTPAIISFRILPPLWQRWWFLALAVLLAGAAVYFGHRYHIARVVEIERVRTRIATDLHDDIGASLSRMAILSEVVKQQNGANQEQSVRMLTDIADSARGLVDSMSDIVWSIDPRRDDLKHVITRARQFAADVFETQGIAWDFTAPPEIEKIKLGPDQRRHLFLILKEAVNNVARHSGCANAALGFHLTGHQLEATVTDDGQGFDISPAEDSSANGHGRSRGGNGLRNMKARAAELGGEVRIDSAPGRGTRFTLTVPLRK